ncbi:MAG: aspartate/glutamate racemase family protein [Clostridia bacterium]|nr:aspartate/glutamate racemase family protein [Clostridia bacterium]
MDKRCVVICDSGIGGLRLLKKLQVRFPNENFVYFADYKNLPYGEKSKGELFEIAEENYNKASKFSPKLVVFACNTLSTNVLPYFPQKQVRVMGVYPEVSVGKGILLCTLGTAKSQYVKDLKLQNDNLDVLALKSFASQIENVSRYGGEFSLDELNDCELKKYDYVSLGCTHYPYAENYLRKIFKKTPFISGESRTFDKIEFFLTTNDAGEQNGSVSFVGSGCENLKNLYNKGIFII